MTRITSSAFLGAQARSFSEPETFPVFGLTKCKREHAAHVTAS